MVNFVGYLSLVCFLIISVAGLIPDFVTNAGKAKRIIFIVLLAVATASAVYSLHEGNTQHAQDSGRIVQLQANVTQAGDRQQESAKQFIQGQKESTAIFVSKYDDLSQKVAALQTGIKTADLQQEADGLRKELKATQEALVVPKAKLTFSLTNTKVPTRSEALPVRNGIVHISFYIMNEGTANALDGDVVLLICGDCSYAKEPPSFVKIEGAPDNQRNFSFQRILAHTKIKLLEADIRVKPTDPIIVFGVKVICTTCEVVPIGPPSPDMTAHIMLLRSQ